MSLYDKQHFVGCCDCSELQPVIHRSSLRSDETDEEAISAYADFLSKHRSHRTTEFRRHGSESRSDRPLWDPMATMMFEVTDGERVYVVSALRQSIEEPRVYRFSPGGLEAEISEVHIDPGDVRRGLDLQFFPHALRPTKLNHFLSALQEVISRIDPSELPIAFDAADDPAVSIARMPDAVYQDLLARCAEIFDPWEFSRVLAFLRENRDTDGLLALRVRRHLTPLTA